MSSFNPSLTLIGELNEVVDLFAENYPEIERGPAEEFEEARPLGGPGVDC